VSGEQRFRVVVGDTDHEVSVAFDDEGRVARVLVDGVEHEVLPTAGGALRVRAGEGAPQLVWLEPGPRPTAASVQGVAVSIDVRTAREAALADALAQASGARGSGEAIAAPMPGRVVKMLVAPGDDVLADQPVAIVEAMKMENEIRSVRAGRVAKVGAVAGDTVDGGALLVELEPHPAPA
jgi:biotin carboxyl carrier protein